MRKRCTAFTNSENSQFTNSENSRQHARPSSLIGLIIYLFLVYQYNASARMDDFCQIAQMLCKVDPDRTCRNKPYFLMSLLRYLGDNSFSNNSNTTNNKNNNYNFILVSLHNRGQLL